MARTSKYTHKGDTRRSEPVAVYGDHHDPSLLNPGADPDLDPETERTALNATDTIRRLDAPVERLPVLERAEAWRDGPLVDASMTEALPGGLR